MTALAGIIGMMISLLLMARSSKEITSREWLFLFIGSCFQVFVLLLYVFLMQSPVR